MSIISGVGRILGASTIKNKAHFAGWLSHSSNLKGQAPIIGLQFLGALMAPPNERGKALAQGLASYWVTSAFLSPGKQMLWGGLMGISPSFSSMARGLVAGHRSSIEQRTMGTIPFSYSSVNMDQAMVTLSSVRERMGNLSYGSKSQVAEQMKIGSEAQMYSARYMAK